MKRAKFRQRESGKRARFDAWRIDSSRDVPLPAVPTTFFGRLVGTAFSLPWSTLQYRFAICSFTSRFDRIEEHARVSFQHSSSSCQTFGNQRPFVRFYIFSRSCGESSSRKRPNRSQNFSNFVPPKCGFGESLPVRRCCTQEDWILIFLPWSRTSKCRE